MKKIVYFLMMALMVCGAVSCKKDKLLHKIPKEAVDMGIVMTREDGTTYKLYWAKSNLCESGLCANPEDYGDYYAWGDPEPYYTKGHSQDNPCNSWRNGKTGYVWESYRFRTSGDSWDNVKFSKYNTKDTYGQVDNKTVLDPSDDAAHAKLGGKWRMPTDVEWAALLDQCITWERTTINGINGCLETAANGNSIFLPAAGCRDEDRGRDMGSGGFYWSSSLNTNNPSEAYDIYFYSDRLWRNDYSRCFGRSIRPVWEE